MFEKFKKEEEIILFKIQKAAKISIKTLLDRS